ncbi:MAG: peptidylprolyl isomerase [bacterium]
MATAKSGDKVKIEFEGKTAEGNIFQRPADGPLEFTLGKSEVIPGLEEAVFGMSVGESKTVEVPAEKAFGQYSEKLVAELDPKSIPPEQKVEEGQSLELHRSDGQSLPAIVLSVSETSVMIDANHPLAGRDLVFTIKLLEIK